MRYGKAYCSTVRYAVIQVSSTKDHPERLVIAYADENCQRDVIAAPSIIGPGFESREERDGEHSRQHAEPHCFETIASPQGDV
jgi:hypothetical protein